MCLCFACFIKSTQGTLGLLTIGAVYRKHNSSHITTSQTKSCMVLTWSMATNNNQEGEPRTTALERQVQTLSATVERLTKQNHDLEEQLH